MRPLALVLALAIAFRTAAAADSTMTAGHMRMTMRQPPSAGDSARAAAIVAALRPTMAHYADYRVALADGYKIFLPKIPQPHYHFSSRRNAIVAQYRFDPAKPTSLLYEKTGDSSYRLIGAMYTAPRGATMADLNRRVPLSVAQWHEHVDWCLPPLLHPSQWGQKGADGHPLFGGNGTITTEAACTAAGGRFHPIFFGWMVHVHPDATDPAAVWGPEEMSNMSDMHGMR